MKITSISDTHGYDICKILKGKSGDILIHAGDALNRGNIIEFGNFLQQMESLDFKYKIFVPGNHDLICETLNEVFINKVLENYNIHILIDNFIMVDDIKIYGSPWQPEFRNWAFNLPRGEKLAEKWDMIPLDTDILITHTPPAHKLDMTCRNEVIGCLDLLERIKIVKPKFHFFGHNHNDGGKTAFDEFTIYANCAVCNERYKPLNNIIEIEI